MMVYTTTLAIMQRGLVPSATVELRTTEPFERLLLALLTDENDYRATAQRGDRQTWRLGSNEYASYVRTVRALQEPAP